MAPAQLFQFGYVSRAHGLAGEVVVRTFDPASTALGEVEQVVVKLRGGTERTLTVKDVRDGPKGDLLATFKGVCSRVQADELRGAALFVRRDDLDEPDDGEYFQGDLVGLTVVTVAGVSLGVVTDLFAAGPVPNLVVTPAQGGDEVMIPFAADFIKEVDLEGGRLVVEPPVYEER